MAVKIVDTSSLGIPPKGKGVAKEFFVAATKLEVGKSVMYPTKGSGSYVRLAASILNAISDKVFSVKHTKEGTYLSRRA